MQTIEVVGGGYDGSRCTEADDRSEAPLGNKTKSTPVGKSEGIMIETKEEKQRVAKAKGSIRIGQKDSCNSAEEALVSRLSRKVGQSDNVRWGLIDRIKAEIADGTFETPDRIETTVDILMGELLG